jgi:hypothetical protein
MDSRNDTVWQQGYVLSPEGAMNLGLANPAAEKDSLILMVSHDCDLVESADVEPFCEIIVGRRITKVDGTFTTAKNPRRLHLEFSSGDEKIAGEFFAADKKQIEKASFLRQAPDPNIRLRSDDQHWLQVWLSIRYFRGIFPDEFDRRLKAKPAEVHKKIGNTIKGTGSHLVMVLFDIDGGRDLIHDGPNDLYSLTILLIYDVSKDPGVAEAAAKKAAQSIKSIFRNHYFIGGQWKDIEFRDCLPISEDALTFYSWRRSKIWHFDYLIMREVAPE